MIHERLLIMLLVITFLSEFLLANPNENNAPVVRNDDHDFYHWIFHK